MRFSSTAGVFALGLLFLNTFAVPVQQDNGFQEADASLPRGITTSKIDVIPNDKRGVTTSEIDVIPNDKRGVSTSKIEVVPIDTRGVTTSKTEVVPNDPRDAALDEIVARARVRSGRTRTHVKPKAKPKKTTKKQTTKAKKRPTQSKSKKPSKTKTKTAATAKASQKPWEEPVPSEAQITKKCKVPKDKAIFWSGVWPETEAYAKQKKLVHDELAYPKGYTLKYMRPNGKAYDEKKNQLFAKRFSKVFARKARGVVYVMVPWEQGPKAGRVFAKDEWPILKKSLQAGRVTKIVQVNPGNFKETREYDPKVYGLTKRNGVQRRGVDFDIDLANVPWDVNLDALEEAFERDARR